MPTAHIYDMLKTKSGVPKSTKTNSPGYTVALTLQLVSYFHYTSFSALRVASISRSVFINSAVSKMIQGSLKLREEDFSFLY